MDEESDDLEEFPFDAGSFGDWLESTTRSTGRSREEILQQLIASYWAMNEVRMEAPSSQIEESRSGGGDRTEGTGVDPRAAFPEISELRTQVEELREQVEELEEGSLDDDDALSELRETLDTHAERIAEADETAARAMELYETLVESQQSIRKRHRELTADHNSLREVVDGEFDNLRTILEYLIETAERNEAALDELRTSHEDLLVEREKLIELQTEALRLGVENAECESCGTEIEPRALVTPACPHCKRAFNGIDQDSHGGGFWQRIFDSGSDILTTAEDSRREPVESPTGTETGTEDIADELDDGGFKWMDDWTEHVSDR